jgi:hypothetical protein
MAAWSLSAKAKARKKERTLKVRRWLRRLLALFVIGVCAFAAYPRVHTMIVARSVAADLRPYVRGKGVAVAPPGAGYSVRLPKAPVGRDAHAAVVTGRDYQITVRQADVPGGELPHGVLGGLKDPKIGGTGTLGDVHQARVAGEIAYVGTFVSSSALPRRVAVVLHRGRLFVIRVQAQQVGPVFDAVVKSFRFTF